MDASPYPGLAAFQENDAGRFFGRGADVLEVVTRLRDRPIAAVVGASGVGKSSFVRAGVVPALKAAPESWEVIVLRPGREPLQSLATMLRPLTTARQSLATDEHQEIVERLRESPGHLGTILRTRAAQRPAPSAIR